ncbi:Na+/H+ antiporter NhaC family protein [Anaerovorax sp. IOR16]|uniref:Na+/H+ antiporter NhaC family protein n=1 Tax=Anaerovorax sp. IOR16 TaxID=2773458 RepID=UPI0019D14724|nr:Na+/H+ antiporter NhaC family protein [Anaerovorax sp. IOR16]
MFHNILVLLPLIFVILSALITKRMSESLIIGTLLAMVILHKQNFLAGTINALYATLSNRSFQFSLMVIICFGALIKLLQESGALMGFRNLVLKVAKGPRSSLFIAWLLSLIMFVDDYLNALTTSFAMHDITDKNRVPREHLALQTHGMSCSLCILIPFTSWTAFTISIISENGMGFNEYLRAIPYMFFPILMVILCLFLALKLFPRIGTLNEAYKRVNSGGPTFLKEKEASSIIDLEAFNENKVSSAFNTILPIIAMITGVFIFDNDLVYGLFIALIVQFVLYIGQKLMTVEEFFQNFFEGAKSMMLIAIVIAFGFTLSKANEELGLFDLLIGSVGQMIPVSLFPAVAFLLTSLCVFAIGSCWVVMLIAIPIFLSLAAATGASTIIVLAAVMSGVVMGLTLCFYSDTVFMTAAGTGVSNVQIIKTMLPYTLLISITSVVGYLILGFVS